MSTGRTKKVSMRYIEREGKDGDMTVYCQLTYDRKSTQFRLQNGSQKLSDEKESWVLNIVQYEAEQAGDDYQIKGIGDRLTFYENPILTHLSPFVENQLLLSLQDILTYAEYTHLTSGLPQGNKFEDAYYSYFYLVNYLWVIKHNFKRDLRQLTQGYLFKLIQAYLAFVYYEVQQLRKSGKPVSKFSSGVTIMGDWLLNNLEYKNQFAKFLDHGLSPDMRGKLIGMEKKIFFEVFDEFEIDLEDKAFMSSQLDGAILDMKRAYFREG